MNIDLILDKITNENIDINLRAMTNLHNKIQTNLISIDKINEKTATKFLLCFGKWFSYYLGYRTQFEYDDTFIIRTLALFKNAIEVFPPKAVQILKQQIKISNLINDIGEIKNEFRGICDQVLQGVSKVALSMTEGVPNTIAMPNVQNVPLNTSNNVSFNYSVSKQDESVISPLKTSNKQIEHINTQQMTQSNNNQSVSFKPANGNVPPTFNKVNVNQQEEQFVFDLGINLKFGDCLQIYKSFYILRAMVLNDYPIEYILQCDELVKSFFNILVNCNFLEFGVSCYKILDKILNLLEAKVKKHLNGVHSLYQLKDFDTIALDENSVCSIETFLLYSLFSVINSLYDINKMSFYIELLKKNFTFVKKVLIHSKQWNDIYYKILFELDKVVLFYKSKNYDAKVFFNFVLEEYVNMDDNDLLELIETEDKEIEPLQFIKDIFFIITQNDLCIQLIRKFEQIKQDSVQVQKFLIDFNNANLIYKSLEMTKQMLSGQTPLEVIIDNFYNILLSLKYINNNSNEGEYENIFPNSTSPLIKAIIDYYQQDYNNNKQKSIDLLIKLLSFKSSEKIEATLSLYKSILDEIKLKGKSIFPLFLNKEILYLFLNDLTNDSYQDVILEIIFELFSDEEIYTNLEIKNIFMLIPPFNNNFKFTSLQSKIDSTLSYEGIMVKYLRFLFSKNETVRYTAINFFNSNQNVNASADMSNSSINDIDDSLLKKNYSKFKSVDTLLLIQTITNEFIKLIQVANSNSENAIEFMPLLNILYSSKMDYNMKTSALEQMIIGIKNANYKEYYINDILNFIVKELFANETKFNMANMGNYFVSLLKLLNCIIYFYMKEEKVKMFINFKNSKELINLLIGIALQKENSKHMMSAYALMYIYFVIFYYGNNEDINDFPVMKFFDKFYYVNLIPISLIDITKNIVNSSVLNFSITKNIIDYIYFRAHPLLKIFNIEAIDSNLKKMKSLNLLDVYISITQLFSCYSIYYDKMDISESLVQIIFYFKKVIPNTSELKNLIMDFLSIVDLFLYQNKSLNHNETFSKIFIPFIQEMILNCINFATIQKEFINNLNEENQNFIYEILEFLLNNQIYFPNKKTEIIQRFTEAYQNVLVFNTESNFYKIKLLLIKFESIFFHRLLPIFSDKIYSDTINTISFFLTKYDPSSTYYNLNYITWTLHFIIQLIKANKAREAIQSKTFIFVKLLQSPFNQIKILSIQILTMLLSNDLFEKHGTILTEVFNTAKSTNDKVLKSNMFNFLIKTFEFFISNKTIDSQGNNIDDFLSEIITMNENIMEQSEMISMITSLSDTESMTSALALKYISTVLNLHIDDEDYIKGVFFNFNFYDNINDVLLKEIRTLIDIIQTDNANTPVLNTNKDINSFYVYSDRELKKKIEMTAVIESVLNIKEVLSMLIRSFPLLTEDLFNQYHTNLEENYINFVKYNQLVVKCWNIFVSVTEEKASTMIKVLQSYTLKYFCYVHFIYDCGYDIMTNVNNISKNFGQEINDVCYDMMKFDIESQFKKDMKIMFSKILPYLIEGTKKKTKIKNEGDSLLELMTTFKEVYGIKVDVYGKKVNCVFKIENNNIKIKNDLVNSISALLLTSQNCKRIFVKTKFINTFIDYITQLTECLLNLNLDKVPVNTKQPLEASVLATNRQKNQMLIEYIINEYSNVLMLLQNLFYQFNSCEERDELFASNLSVSTISSTSSVSSNATSSKSKFLLMLFNIFYDTIRYSELFKNYLKLLINILSNNGGELSRYFLLPLTKNKDTLLSLLLDHFSKSIFVLASNPNFEFYIQFLKCLLQHKPISSTLLKTKFTENLKNELIKLIENKKTFQNPKQVKIIQELMEVFVSLSFDSEQAKKLGNKEFIISLSEAIIKTKNENVIYNIIFFYRNISFVNQIKNVFMSEGNLIASIFAIFTGEYSIRIKYIISHLIWVLLYNNQTLRTMLNRPEFKSELTSMNIHFQKELDMEKLNEEEEKKDENTHKWLEDTCLNMRKIMHIIELE